MPTIKIAPSILSADFGKLEQEIKAVETAGADWIHFDVMDGHFVPNITIGIPVLESIRKSTKLPIDVHLMIENPERYVLDFCKAGADYVSVHAEAATHLHRILESIKKYADRDVKTGIAFNPGTRQNIPDYLINDHLADMILVMTVNPGFAKQKFIEGALENVRLLRHRFPELDIEVDGGIGYKSNLGPNSSITPLSSTHTPAYKAAEAGANILVAGSAVFYEENYKLAIEKIREHASMGQKIYYKN